jgi:hypothetical protein
VPDNRKDLPALGFRALLPEHWLGRVGEIFRSLARSVSDYVTNDVHLGERLKQAPNVAIDALQGAALEKHSTSLLNYAKEEHERTVGELAKRTALHKYRQESAIADKLEAEALSARIDAVKKLWEVMRDAGVTFVVQEFDGKSSMSLVKAPPAFNWEELLQVMLAEMGKASGAGK